MWNFVLIFQSVYSSRMVFTEPAIVLSSIPQCAQNSCPKSSFCPFLRWETGFPSIPRWERSHLSPGSDKGPKIVQKLGDQSKTEGVWIASTTAVSYLHETAISASQHDSALACIDSSWRTIFRTRPLRFNFIFGPAASYQPLFSSSRVFESIQTSVEDTHETIWCDTSNLVTKTANHDLRTLDGISSQLKWGNVKLVRLRECMLRQTDPMRDMSRDFNKTLQKRIYDFFAIYWVLFGFCWNLQKS